MANEVKFEFTEEELKDYEKAGKIWKETADYAKSIIKKDMKLLDIANKVEAKIYELEGKPAFPLNLSINNQAAHYTPSFNDETVVQEDVLKVDIGVHVNGQICDGAFTLDFSNENGKLVEAAEKAIENVKSILKPGITPKAIGTEIEKTITELNYNPIRNLSGHLMAKFILHAGVSVPNMETQDETTFDSCAIAIEPFATDGEGYIKEGGFCEIYELNKPAPLRNTTARLILEDIAENYQTLPFAERWIRKEEYSPIQFKMAIREMLQKEVIKEHHLLKEDDGKLVSQHEITALIANDEVKILNE